LLRKINFEVHWEDGDDAWEESSNINECAALDKYLVFCEVEDPNKLLYKNLYIIMELYFEYGQLAL
jgi:hypothetical protein